MSSTQSSTADADAPGLSRVSDKQGQTSGRGTPHPHARYNPAYQSIDIPLYSSLSPPDQEVCLCSLAISAEEEPALRVSLRKTRMQESRGLYWCLSHVWAHSDLTDNVLINGHRRKVNSNLFTNLCQLHAAKPGAAFWVDALCINQADLQERAAQVELMGAIYAKSKGVLVSFEDAGRTQRVSSLGIRAKSLVTYLLNLQCYPSAIAGPHASSADFKASARALCQLLKSQWFGRSWVVQEVCRGQHVELLSLDLITWDDFTDALESWEYHRHNCCSQSCCQLPRDLIDSLHGALCFVKSIQATKEALSHRHHILDAILCYQDTATTRATDKVYAFHPLHSAEVKLPAVNYNQTTKAVFTDHALWFLRSMGSLFILALEFRRETPDLPTWVPDFAGKPVLESNYGRLRYQFLQVYDAAKGLRMVPPKVEAGKLVVSGVRIGLITGTATNAMALCSPEHHLQQHIRVLQEWARIFHGKQALDTPCNDLLYDRAFAELMMGGCFLKENHSLSRRLQLRDVLRWQDHLSEMLNRGSEASEDIFHTPDMLTHLAAVLERRLFWSDSGCLGLGPASLDINDELWIFPGGTAPLVLRRVCQGSDGRQEFDLVGHCYLAGAMFGENLDSCGAHEECVIC